MNKMQLLLLSALTLPLSIGVAHAVVNPDKLPQVQCSQLNWGSAFLDKYPQAPGACLDAREYKGQRYGKFEAKVYISDPSFMTVQLLNKAGDTVTTFSFKPSPNQRVLVNGQPKAFHDLQVGEKITIWVSEKRMEAEELPGSTHSSWAGLPPMSK
jgi:hypothetical protein